MKLPQTLLASIIFICILCAGLPGVIADTKTQEPLLLQWYLNNAEVDLGNAKFSLSVYDNVLNYTTKLKIYTDMVTSYDQTNQALAEYSEPSNFNFSLQSGRFAMFLASSLSSSLIGTVVIIITFMVMLALEAMFAVVVMVTVGAVMAVPAVGVGVGVAVGVTVGVGIGAGGVASARALVSTDNPRTAIYLS